jgi:propanediol dehydratase small subunit
VTKRLFGIPDYPLAETCPGEVRGARGVSLDELSLERVVAGKITMEDLRITPQSLSRQAEISRAAGRPTLALNLERAAEMAALPQQVIMEIYELLRPGRAKGDAELISAAKLLRQTYGTFKLAAFLEEAAEVYRRRGLYIDRY